MSKEKILDEYRKKFGLCDGSLKHCSCKRELDFISKAIAQTREETIREVEEMVNKIIVKDLTGKWSNDVVDFYTSIVNATVSKIKQSLKSLINK